MTNERSRTDPTGFPTLPTKWDQEYNNYSFQYLKGIVVSDATESVGTAGATAANSAGSYCGKHGSVNPGKLACDKTWKIRDDEGNDWYIPLFRYG